MIPLTPSGLSIIRQYHGSMQTTVMLDWDPPQGRGPEAIVDNYTISILPAPLFQPARITVPSGPYNVTLAHNELYAINLAAVNCAGESGRTTIFLRFSKSVLVVNVMEHCSIIFFYTADCGDPMLPADATGTYPHTRERAIVIYRCRNGFRPSAEMIAVCTVTGQWMPPIVNCTLVTG